MIKIVVKNNSQPKKEIKKEEIEYYVCRNVIVLNGKEYVGKVKGDKDLINTLKYLDQKIDEEREHIKDETVHPEVEICKIRGNHDH